MIPKEEIKFEGTIEEEDEDFFSFFLSVPNLVLKASSQNVCLSLNQNQNWYNTVAVNIGIRLLQVSYLYLSLCAFGLSSALSLCNC